MPRTIGTTLLKSLLPSLFAITACAQQVSDPDFDIKVAKPAYVDKHPRVLFDAAHHNFHTADGRYKPFADLIKSDGCTVKPNTDKFSKTVLAECDVLIIANALGAEAMSSADAVKPAFTDEECDCVRDWVRSGGALLLITDHFPMGYAAETLGKRFDIDMSKGGTEQYTLTRDAGRVGDHPINAGRDESERINKVGTFTGQTLRGPAGSVAFLKVPDDAVERIADPKNPNDAKKSSAGGRAQGIALTLGKGRVVVMGEAAMLSAQLAGPTKHPVGMNVPGLDNRQLALNIIHWLTGILPENSNAQPASDKRD